MITKKQIFVCLTLFSLLWACSPKTVISKPAETKTDTQTTGEFAEAKLIFNSKCTMCHGIKNMAFYTESQLQSIVPNMVKMTNNKAGSMVINEAQKADLLKYLTSICKK